MAIDIVTEFLSETQAPRARLEMSDFKAQVEVAVMARGGRQHGNEIRFRCPYHDDNHPSADYNIAKGVWICRTYRYAGGTTGKNKRSTCPCGRNQ